MKFNLVKKFHTLKLLINDNKNFFYSYTHRKRKEKHDFYFQCIADIHILELQHQQMYF